MRVPFYRQQKPHTCGPAVLRMALAAHGLRYTERYLARLAGTNAMHGTSNFGLMRVLRTLGVPYSTEYRTRYRSLAAYAHEGVAIVDWMPQYVYPEHPEFVHSREFDPETDGHYAVVVSAAPRFVTLQDPVLGRRVRVTRAEFVRAWRDPTSKSAHWVLAVLPPHGEE